MLLARGVSACDIILCKPTREKEDIEMAIGVTEFLIALVMGLASLAAIGGVVYVAVKAARR